MSPIRDFVMQDYVEGRASRWFFVAAMLILATLPASAQPVEQLPGFVDFTNFGDFDADDLRIEINLGGSLLEMLSTAVEDEDGEYGALLQRLSLIKVNVFEADGLAHARSTLNGALRQLRSEGWEAVVSIRDEENLHILLRTDNNSILGLLAAFSDDESFGLVNIVGDFDPKQIGRLARQLDIEPLSDLNLELSQTHSDDEEDGEDDGEEDDGEGGDGEERKWRFQERLP